MSLRFLLSFGHVWSYLLSQIVKHWKVKIRQTFIVFQVHVFLKSSSWDTRIAAGQAIEAIAQNVPQWDPATSQKIKGM